MEQDHFEALYPDTARSTEINELLSFIHKGSSCQLLGIPGVSRSTLLGLLAHNKPLRKRHLGVKQKELHFVMANFSEIRKRPLLDAMKFLFLSLADSLRERGMTDDYRRVNEIFKESLAFSDELVLFQGLKEAIDYLALERKLTIVFMFDRFEEYIPTVTSEFFTNLRTLRNRAKYHFSIIFSLNRPLESILEPSLLADYYEFVAGNLVFVRLYDKQATDFRISYIEQITGKQISKPVLKEILRLTGGHGKLTKLAVEAVLAHGEKKESSFFLDRKSIQTALLEIWNALSPAEQADLLAEKFEDEDIVAYFEQTGLLKDKTSGIPLFREFILDRFTVPQIEKQHISFDQHTNTIKKGNVTLSDQLTSSEFRLLKYLLQNHGKVVEREELINIVWQDNKSVAGITDQAVDQLIFRVRRKIEEDPNKPIHLETIKGRGFRFAP